MKARVLLTGITLAALTLAPYLTTSATAAIGRQKSTTGATSPTAAKHSAKSKKQKAAKKDRKTKKTTKKSGLPSVFGRKSKSKS